MKYWQSMNPSDHTFSVVVNTTDRAATLETLLHSLEHQSYPHFEVIAVVGPTRDHTMELLARYADRVRILRCAVPNLSVSRNIGLAAARGDIVAYIDDDAVPARNWLAQLNRIFQDPTIDGTGGEVHLIHPNSPTVQHRLGYMSDLGEQVDVRSGLLDRMPVAGKGRLWTLRMMGTNMAYRRRSLLAISGFDEFYEWVYDEADVAVRMAAHGQIVQPVTESRIYHIPASSRNRVAFTNIGRWWIQTKAGVYFSIRNGRAAGTPTREIARRVLHLFHGHWRHMGHLFRHGKISFRDLCYYRAQEVKSTLHGVMAAVWGERRMLKLENIHSEGEEIRRFQTAESSHKPTVDPVSGRSPQIVMEDPPLRIGLLSFTYPPDPTEGISRFSSMLARGLFELGHTVHVVAHGKIPGIIFDGSAYVHRINYRLDRYQHLRHLPRVHHLLNYSHAAHETVKRLMLNDDIQIVDSPLWKADGFVTAVSGMIPVVVRPQTALRQVADINSQHEQDAHLVGEIEEGLLRRADYILPNSRATAEAMKKVYRLDLDALPHAIASLGVDFAPDEEIRPFPLENPPTELVILYVGRLEKRKGIQDLFEAIPAVRAILPQVRFILAGADNSGSDGFRARTGLDYATYFNQKYPQHAQAVTFLGHVDDKQLQELYQACHLFVAPSLYESFGLIYLEAMNYAKPVVGCNAGGIPEIVEDGVTGTLVEPASPQALAHALVELAQSPRKLYEYGMAGRRRFLDKFTYLHMARSFVAAYRETLQARAADLAQPSSLSTAGVIETPASEPGIHSGGGTQ